MHRGRLKRSEIAAECGFGKSALVQNPVIRAALEVLQGELRERGTPYRKDQVLHSVFAAALVRLGSAHHL